MSKKLSAKDGGNEPDKAPPRVGVALRVRHEGRELLAYRNGQGKWRDYYNGDVLNGEVPIIETSSS